MTAATASGGRPARRPKLMQAALAAAERGWHVFPLRPGDKRPAIRDWETRATTDPDRIIGCWTAGPYNVGIACGPSDLVVLDLDTAKPGAPIPPPWAGTEVRDGRAVLAALAEEQGQHLPGPTFTVRTRSGGTHLYFNAPDGDRLRNSAGRLGWLIDSRADGGYVVAAGSVVGLRAYRVVDAAPPARLPSWIAQGLVVPAADDTPAPTEATLTAIRDRSSYATSALRAEIAHVLAAEPGTRNHTLNAAAFALGRLVASGLLPDAVATEALTRAGQVAGLTDHEIAATVRSGLTAGSRHPRVLAAEAAADRPARQTPAERQPAERPTPERQVQA